MGNPKTLATESGIGPRIHDPIPPVAENYPILIDRVFAQNLANQLGRVGARDRLELLHAAGETVGHEQIAVLIGRDPVRARQPPGLESGGPQL